MSIMAGSSEHTFQTTAYNLSNDILLKKIPMENYISSINFSGNDKYLIYQDSSSIIVQNTIDEQDKFSIGDEENPVLDYAIAKDILAYAQKDTVYLYNLEKREIINNVPYDNWSFALSTDGKMVFLLQTDGDIEKRIAHENGSMLKGIIHTQNMPTDTFAKIQVTPDNSHIIYITEKFIDIYNLSTNKRVNRLPKAMWSDIMDISEDGKYIAVADSLGVSIYAMGKE